MGIITNLETGQVVFESDDPAAIKEKVDALEAERRKKVPKDEPLPVIYSVEGFDSHEIESGEVRDDAPHEIPPEEEPYNPPDLPPEEAPAED